MKYMTAKNKTYILTAIITIIGFSMDVNVSFAKDLTEETGQELLKELKELKEAIKDLKAPKKAPEPKKDAKVTTKGGEPLGKKNAPVVIVEFTDYQCPFCKRFMDTTFLEIKKQYIDTGKVKFVSRNLPLPFHKQAKDAAEAVMCAGDQDKYWEMRDLLFKNPRALSSEDLHNYATDFSLNMKKFSNCMRDHKYLKQINKDMADSALIGISGTPSFVVAPNTGTELIGQVVVGAQPFPAFDKVIKEMLKK